MEQFVSRFVRGELNHPYGTWFEHAATWFYTRRNSPNFLLVSYEALQSKRLCPRAQVIHGPAQLVGEHGQGFGLTVRVFEFGKICFSRADSGG